MSSLSIYPASHTHLASFWVSLVKDWPEFQWVARWPEALKGGRTDAPEWAEMGWRENMEDLQRADWLLCYTDSYTPLRGALVEAGGMLALGKPVLLVGFNSSWGSWQFHPNCHHVRDLSHARDFLNQRRRVD